MKIQRFLILFLMMEWTFFGFVMGKGKLEEVFLEEVLSVGSLESDVIYMWAGITTDSQGTIYVTDAMDYSIKKFNQEGVFMGKVGRKGKGPKEFLAPRDIRYFKEHLYVTDQYIPGIKVFDGNLKYQSHIPLKFPVWDFEILSEEKIFISSPIMSRPERLILVDSQGEMDREMEWSGEFDEYWERFLKFETDDQGSVYVIFTFQDKIKKYNKDRDLIWTKSLFGQRRVKRERTKNSKWGHQEVPLETVYKDIALDTQGRVYILGGDFSKHSGRIVYVLDEEGNRLTQFLLPESSHCIHIDDHNFLYSRGEEGTSVKKYSMKFIYKQ